MRVCRLQDFSVEGSGLHREEAGAAAGVPIGAIQAALEQLAREDRTGIFGRGADGHYVADENLAEAGGQRGCVVADLIGVRKDHLRGAFFFDELVKGQNETIRSVWREEWMLDADDFGERVCCDFGGGRFGLQPDDSSAHGQIQLRGQLLPGSEGLPTDATDAACTIFDYDQNAAHRRRASKFSFSTSAAVASLAVPGSICVDFCLRGNVTRSNTTTGAASTASSAAVTERTSLVLARLMPISVA